MCQMARQVWLGGGTDEEQLPQMSLNAHGGASCLSAQITKPRPCRPETATVQFCSLSDFVKARSAVSSRLRWNLYCAATRSSANSSAASTILARSG